MLRVIDFAKTVLAASWTQGRSMAIGALAVTGLIALPAVSVAQPLFGDMTAVEAAPGGQLLPGDILDVSMSITQYTAFSYEAASDMAMSLDLSSAYPGIVVYNNGGSTRACDLPGPGFGESSLSFSGMAIPEVLPSNGCSISFSVRLPDDIPPGVYTFEPSDLTGVYELDGPVPFTHVIPDFSFTVEADTGLPGVEVSTASLTVLNAPFDGVISFDEPVSGFDVSDVTATGGTVSIVAVAGGDEGALSSNYQMTVTPAGIGTVTVQVPAGGALDEAGNANTISNLLSVEVVDSFDEVVTIAMEVTDGPVAPGGVATLRVTLSNPHPTDALSAGVFVANLSSALSGLEASAPLPVTPCGASSALSGTTFLFGTGLEVPASDTCAFDILLAVPGDAPGGLYPIFSSAFTHTLGAATGLSALPAQASLAVIGAEGIGAPAVFSKNFAVDPVLAGTTVSLEYTIVPAEGFDATALTFTDDLDGTLSGLAATGLPMSDICGEGSTLSGTTTVTLSGGNVADGDTCVFSINVDVPEGAAGGTYPSTTSSLTGMHNDGSGEVALTVAGASDSLSVTALIPTAVVTGPAGDVGGAFTAEIRFSQSVTGLELADFTITNGTATTLTGSGTDYALIVTPAGLGATTVTVPADAADNAVPTGNSISNTLSVTVVAAIPAIEVSGLGMEITSFDLLPSDVDGTDFGDVGVISGTLTRTFRIENTGTGPLTLSGGSPVTISGVGAASFSVVSQPAGPIPAGGSVTFQIIYDPAALGLDSARIDIANDADCYGTFAFGIQGTGISAPEIEVEGNSVVIADNDSSASSADHTDFGSVDQGTTLTRTFTINNTGGGTLNLGANAVSLSGVNAADFSVTDQPDTSVAPAGTTTFDVRFSPSALGSRNASVSIANDDSDESPYNFSITGSGTGGPEVNLTGLSVTILDGATATSVSDNTDFGSSNTGVSVLHTFIIHNTGTTILNLSPAPIEVSGDVAGSTIVDVLDSTQFAVATRPSDTVAPGGSTSFTLRFNPLATGAHTATVGFGTNDVDEGRYTFTVSGTGTAPEIDVTGLGVDVADGSTTTSATNGTILADAGVASGSSSRTFTINNTGSGVLTLGSSAVTLSGTDAADFSVTTQPATSVAAAGSTTFTIEFDPSATGVREATVSIANDDADEAPFDFAIEGTGLDLTAPMGFSVAFDDSVINNAESSSTSFTFTGAEVGTTYDYTISTSGGASTATGSAAVTSSGQTISGIDLSGLEDGTLTLSVTLTDAATNVGGPETDTGSLDRTLPSLSISGPSGTQTGAFTANLDFDESVSGFVVGDITPGNSTLSDFAGSGAAYTVLVTPAANGAVTLNVAADVAADAAANGNTIATEFSVQADITQPTVTSVVVSDADVRLADVGGAAFTVAATFSEPLDPGTDPTLAFVGGDLSGTLLFQSGAFSGGDTVYTGTYTVADGGLNLVDVDVNVSGGTDVAGNDVTGSTTNDLFSVEMRRGSITVTQNVTGSIDGDFDFTGDLGIFAITTVGQTGSQLFDDLAEGTYSFATADEDDFTRDTLTCVGGTTTVDASAGTVDVTMSPTDAVVCTFTSIAAPTIDVASLPVLALTLPTLVDDPTTISQTFAIGNLGGADFNFTAATDVAWMTIDPTSGSIPASGSLNFTIAFTSAVLDLGPGTYAANITITEVPGPTNRPRGDASHAGPIVIPVTITLDPRDGTLTIVTTTAPAEAGDGTFNYSSSLAALNGVSHTTVGGTASTAGLTVLRGTYTMTQATTEGWALDSMSCTGDVDGGSTFDVATGTMTIDLDATEVMVCTFANRRDEDYIVGITTAAIRDFMAQRADQILSNGPRLNRRFRGDRASATPNNFAADFRDGRFNANFSTSLSAIRREVESNQPSVPGQYSTNLNNGTGLSTLDVWVQANFSSIEDDRAGLDSETSFGMYYIGADFLATENIMLGALMQFDSAETITGALNSEVEGDGWMAGPYVVARIDENLYLDARASWGGSENTINPIGLYTDDFETDRMLLEANLAGDIEIGNWRIRPEMGVAYFKETQDSYTDTLGFVIPSQEITLGRFSAGPEISYRITDSEGGFIEPYLRMTGMWDYDDAEVYNAAGNLQGLGTFRADARLGINIEMSNGSLISGEVSMQGIGVGDFEANSAMIHFRLPLTMDW